MNKLIFIICCMTCILYSCSEEIIMDPQEEMPVVVHCVLTREGDVHPKNDSPPQVSFPQYLDLYYSRRPSETEYRKISDAAVQVTGGGKTYEFKWNGDRWEADFMPEFNVVYELTVTLGSTNETIMARTQFPDSFRLKGRYLWEYDPVNRSKVRYYAVLCHRDSSTGGCYYRSADSDAFIWITAKSDDPESGRRLFTSHTGVDNFNVCRGSWSDLDIVDYLHREYYSHHHSDDYWQTYERIGSSLSLHKDFLRIHHTYDYDSGLTDDCYYYQGNDPLYSITSRDLFILGADFPVQSEYQEEYDCRFVSVEYDKYLHDITEISMHRDELADIYSMASVYSNVEGGIGIFGAQWINTSR